MENQTTITDVVMNNERLTNLQLDLLNKHGLAWRVIEEPLVSQSGLPTNQIGLFRSDNNAHLGTHTTRYNPCQNAELAKMLVYACSPIEDLELTESRGGEFFGGKKVFFQIPLPSVTIGNTDVQRFLTALNSFDGSTAVALGTCQTVVVCQNTFYKAYRNAEMSKVGHYSTMRAKLEALTQQIHFTIEKDMKQVELFQRMAETPIFGTDVESLTKKIFDLTDGEEAGTRKANRMTKFNNDLEVEFAEQGYNAWGLFNGVTRYTNHTIKHTNSYSDKMANVICGTGAKINSLALDHITSRFNLN
jgi:phage/plasmid-like protein (TIGR03299 family)